MTLQSREAVARLVVGMEIAVTIDWLCGKQGEGTLRDNRIVDTAISSLEAVLGSGQTAETMKRHCRIVLECAGKTA